LDPTRTILLMGVVLSLLWATTGCTADEDSRSDRMDTPTLPAEQTSVDGSATLRAVMDGLRTDMIHLSEGLWTGSFDRVARSAEAVADHPPVSPAERQRVHAALGEDFPTFVAADRHVHDMALRLREAAEREDTVAVLNSLSDLQKGCIACHTSFRERLAAP
jgi:hypothetical protein